MSAAPAVGYPLHSADADPAAPDKLCIPLIVHAPTACRSIQPVRIGVPLPRGAYDGLLPLELRGSGEQGLPIQARPLAHWPDGSVKWLLLDFLAADIQAGPATYLVQTAATPSATPAIPLRLVESSTSLVAHTGPLTCMLRKAVGVPLLVQFRYGSSGEKGAATWEATYRDAQGRVHYPVVEEVCVEEKGKLRSTLRMTGRIGRKPGLRLVLRLDMHAGTGLVRSRVTLHNPRRARHAGGLWDLGDPGSVLFRSLAFRLLPSGTNPEHFHWTPEADQLPAETATGELEIYQDSSGGPNWQSRNHVTRTGELGPRFRGYRVSMGGRLVQRGDRAQPVVWADTCCGSVAVAVPEFWQQFPKALAVRAGGMDVELFPDAWAGLHELQGGEQKTHDIWMDFGTTGRSADLPLSWVHAPARVCASPAWFAASRALSPFALPAPVAEPFLESLMAYLVAGKQDYRCRREEIDEYGWRNFGDVYADHEAAHFQGSGLPISHYNNQYDLLYGAILQLARSGDLRWWDFLDPLARHVIDIDVYHTKEDRAAYNGGLFWHTDHYRDAKTSTHRSYSAQNAPAQGDYGGGPCNEHLYATGLLHYFYLTGDLQAAETVRGLADGVLAMDDGTRTTLGLVDDGPTGLASSTADQNFHGPGRGAGNAVNTLLDAWLLTGRRTYLDKAEELIQRVLHPADDVASLELLNAEKRWSYTVFLIVLGRYLETKADGGERDAAYAYGRACLLHVAEWMVEHERPYLAHPEELEYPTETWAAQELRKANVLALAARYADIDDLATRLRRRAAEFTERALADLAAFPSRVATRPLAILMTEGVRRLALGHGEPQHAPLPAEAPAFPKRPPFVPQKQRVKRLLRSPRGWLRILLRLMRPAAWSRWLNHRSR